MPRLPSSLFIASLGNPGREYALTRHSAAHVVLSALAADHLNTSFSHDGVLGGAAVAVGHMTWTPAPDRPPKKRKLIPTPTAAAATVAAPSHEQASDDAAPVDGISATTVTPPTPASPSPARAPSPLPPPPPSPVTASWTLWQSPSYMNVSGPPLRTAWRQHQRAMTQLENLSPHLVIVHDSLEHPAGTIAVRADSGKLSSKGHNGIKSVLEAFAAEQKRIKGRGGKKGAKRAGRYSSESDGEIEGGERWTKISIGIGRPESRDADVVARYVLGKMGERELAQLRNGVAQQVVEALKKVT